MPSSLLSLKLREYSAFSTVFEIESSFFSTVFDTFGRQNADSNSSRRVSNHTPHFLIFNVLSWQFLGRLRR